MVFVFQSEADASQTEQNRTELKPDQSQLDLRGLLSGNSLSDGLECTALGRFFTGPSETWL